ncbi:MAG: hypothetical protein ACTIA6_10265 [Pseudoclavibacter sp.]
MVAEVTQHSRYGAGRAWSTRASYTLAKAPKRVYLVHTVEGGFNFTVDGKTEVTEPGQLVLLDGDAPTTARTIAETARFVWYFEPTFLQPGKTRFGFHDPIAVRNASIRALMAMTNSILNAESPVTRNAQAHLGIAMEHLVAGALDETGVLEDRNASMHRDGLFTSAQLVIESHFRNPGFNAQQLAKELSVSTRTVYVAFSAFGTSPRREIERRRLSEVERLAERVPLTTQNAESFGFTSMRQYRRAVDRSALPSPDPEG